MEDSQTSLQESNKTYLVIVFLMIAAVTALHYGTMGPHVAYHTLYRELYFIPIILMSFRYGLDKGFYTAMLVIFLYFPHVLMTWKTQPGVNIGNLLQILVYILVAVATGYLSDREKERHRQVSEARNLASLGKVTLAMASELQEVLKGLKRFQSSGLPSSERSFDENMQGIIDRVTTLNQALLHFRPGHETMRRDFVEVGSAIERARERVSKIAKENRVTVETQLGNVSGLLRINDTDLILMIEELVKNSIEHSAPGKTVTISANQLENQFTISVTDQGRGIASENLSKIFVPFFTTKEKGTGLGLSACRKIIRDNGGDILVESKPGEGSTFSLVFPQMIA
ncbi:MAG: sensor histidine kinase [Desulfocapsaceae bacterium]|nr:sensor histidine kinase [Desulfocapsaceae bacterium]